MPAPHSASPLIHCLLSYTATRSLGCRYMALHQHNRISQWVLLTLLQAVALSPGLTAQSQQCSPACQHGNCQQLLNSQTYACNCTGTGFTGAACSTTDAPAPGPAGPCAPACQHGICRQLLNSQGYACECAGSGFTGLDCADPVAAPSPAASQKTGTCSPPCQNGKCRQLLNSQEYVCDCQGSGFGGMTCSATEIPQQSGCNAGCDQGTCKQDLNSNSYSCQCTSGYTGTYCNVSTASISKSQSADCQPACSNKATCTQALDSQQFHCECAQGFRGSAACSSDSQPQVAAKSGLQGGSPQLVQQHT